MQPSNLRLKKRSAKPASHSAFYNPTKSLNNPISKFSAAAAVEQCPTAVWRKGPYQEKKNRRESVPGQNPFKGEVWGAQLSQPRSKKIRRSKGGLEVEPSSKLAALRGPENIAEITSRAYRDYPITVQGPGAAHRPTSRPYGVRPTAVLYSTVRAN